MLAAGFAEGSASPYINECLRDQLSDNINFEFNFFLDFLQFLFFSWYHL